VLNLENADDAKLFAQNFGEREVTEVSRNFANERTLFFPWRHSSYNEREGKEQRFDYTALMELPKFHAVSRIVRDDAPQEPVLASLDLSPWDKDRNRRRVCELRGAIKTDLPPGVNQPRIELVFPRTNKPVMITSLDEGSPANNWRLWCHERSAAEPAC